MVYSPFADKRAALTTSGIATMIVIAAFANASSSAFATASNDNTVKSKQIDESVRAFWIKSQTPSNQITSLEISKSSDGQTSIIFTLEVNGPENGEHFIGQLLTSDNIFKVDKKLKSATLSPVELEICTFENQNVDGFCNVVADVVTVEAEWNGIGDLTKTTYVSTTNDNSNVVIETTYHRDATATASIDGQDVGSLDTSRSHEITKVVTKTKSS
jgi:hypothetical protein